MDGLAQDTRIKRAVYIKKDCELIQEFGFAHPQVKCKMNGIYNSSFPGSVVWDLNSRNVQMIENSWSVSVRHMWDLPHNAHRFFIEPLGGTHARSMLISRYVSFIQATKKSPKLIVQQLLQMVKQDQESVTGKNIRYILTELNQSDIFNISKDFIKKNLRFQEVAVNNEWKIGFVRELTDVKQNVLFVQENDNGKFSHEEISEIIDYISTI